MNINPTKLTSLHMMFKPYTVMGNRNSMKKAPIAPPNSRWLVLPTRLDVSIGGRSTGSLFSGSFA